MRDGDSFPGPTGPFGGRRYLRGNARVPGKLLRWPQPAVRLFLFHRQTEFTAAPNRNRARREAQDPYRVSSSRIGARGFEVGQGAPLFVAPTRESGEEALINAQLPSDNAPAPRQAYPHSAEVAISPPPRLTDRCLRFTALDWDYLSAPCFRPDFVPVTTSGSSWRMMRSL